MWLPQEIFLSHTDAHFHTYKSTVVEAHNPQSCRANNETLKISDAIKTSPTEQSPKPLTEALLSQ